VFFSLRVLQAAIKKISRIEKKNALFF